LWTWYWNVSNLDWYTTIAARITATKHFSF
jgi:hypothetical protein